MVGGSQQRIGSGPGRHAPARLLSALLLLAVPAAAQAQARRPVPPPAAAAPVQMQVPLPVPDALTVAKLLWSTMSAVDQANKTGNYAVLRELGTPGFQAANDVGRLAATFAGIRQQRLDLSDTLLFEPWFEIPPAYQGPLLRLRGAFRMRPTGVQFDLLYAWNNGWRLEGIALRAMPMGEAQPIGR